MTPLLRSGRNAFGAILGDGWYCGHVAHMARQHYGDRPRLLAQVVVEYDDGSTETIPTDATWKTAEGPIREADLLMGETYDARLELPGWDAPGFDDAEWPSAEIFPAPAARIVAHRGPPVRATQELHPAAPVARADLPDAHHGYIFDLRENMVGVVRLRLREHYGHSVRFIDYLIRTSPGRLRYALDSPGLPCFGDWLALDGSPDAFGGPSKGLIGAAFFAHSARLLSRIAEALGNKQDADEYGRLSDEVRAAFNQHYVKADGTMTSPTQTAYVLALHFDLLPVSGRKAAEDLLVADIKKRGMHLSTGFVGSPYLPHVLTRAGRLDVMFALLHQKHWPSWLYAVTQGATSIWERWDGWTEEKGFQTTDMNSFNHYAYGAIGEWLYNNVAGILWGDAGYKHTVIPPHLGDLTSARASFHSMYGPIVSAWRRESGRFTLDVTIPPNTTATVHVPLVEGKTVLEGSGPAADAEGVRLAHADAESAVFEVGAGEYHFHTEA